MFLQRRNTLKHFKPFAVLCVLLCLSACVQSKYEFTLNPDGSGKVVYHTQTEPDSFNINGDDNDEDDYKEAALDEAKKIVNKSKGVETWKDVSFGVNDEGKIFFKGTAYFKDYHALGLGENSEDAPPSFETFKLNRNAKGELVFAMDNKDRKDDKKVEKKKLSDAELDKKLKKAKNQLKQHIILIAMVLGSRKDEYYFKLPGTLSKVECFKKDKEGRLNLTIDGSKIIEVFKNLEKNDELLKKMIIDGKNITNDAFLTPEILKQIFGSDKTPTATAKGELTALFDYKKEVNEAKKAFEAIKKKLTLTTLPPAKGDGLSSLRVGGVTYIKESDEKNEIRPMHQDKGITMSVIGQFSGAILNFQEVRLDSAITLEGEDILPSTEWNRTSNFNRLSKDFSTGIFDLQMNYPENQFSGFKEVSGELTYLVAKGTKKEDLGVISLFTGNKADKMGMEIKKYSKSDFNDDSYELELQLKVKRTNVKAVEFYDEDKNKIEVHSSGYHSSSNKVTYSYTKDSAFPEKVQIVIFLHDNIQKFIVPFKFEDLDLLGNKL